MKQAHKVRVGAVAGTAVLLLVTACSQAGTGVALLDDPPSTGAALPAALHVNAVEPDSIRFLAEHEGVSYLLGRPAEPGLAHGVCLMAVETDATACSGPSPDESGLVSLDAGGTEARVVRDGTDTADLTDDGWTRIHENLLVR